MILFYFYTYLQNMWQYVAAMELFKYTFDGAVLNNESSAIKFL